jgi:hypothetical protein
MAIGRGWQLNGFWRVRGLVGGRLAGSGFKQAIF